MPYPFQIDNPLSLPHVFDNITQVSADTVNRLRDTIIAIEQALGIEPAGLFASTGGVKARLDDVDTQLVSLNTQVTNVIVQVNDILSDLDGEGIKLGTPIGGFLPGITTLQSITPITEAINTFNSIMSYLAPLQPQSMDSLSIDAVTSLPVFSGKIATLTSPPSGYYGPFTAGSTSTRITQTQSFTITTHNTNDATTGFSDADKGPIDIFVNGVQVTTFALNTAFDEAHRADLAGQGVTYSGGTGSATPPLKLLPAFISPITGQGQIYSIALYNGFPLWQKGVSRVVVSTLIPGYNSFQYRHTVGSTPRLSQVFQLFYDPPTNPAPSFASTPSLTIVGVPTHFNYLSGIKFLTNLESLQVSATINNAFTNTYLQTPLNISFTVGVSSTAISLADPSVQVTPSNNPAAPNTTDQLVVSNKVFPITILNQQTINQITTVAHTNVYGAVVQSQSSSQNLLMNTYNSPASTASSDGFVDENRRLLPDIDGATNTVAAYPNDYVTIPGTLTGQWTSTTALTNGNAQCYNAQLIYPTGNFTTGYLPGQGGSTNYSGFNNSNAHNGQVYYRAMFSSGNPRSTGTLTINGISLLDITQLSPHLKVEMKLPGATGTGWLDFSQAFNSGTFTGATGQGCRTGNSGSSFGWSVGLFTTGNTGYMYILRITLFTTARPISSISESFVQSF